MSKKKKQKYYAIKEGKGVKNKIVRTWSECKELLLGYPSIYKTFYTEEEAIKFLGGINDKDIPAIKEKIKVIGASRTDKGVHALAQMIQFKEAKTIDKDKYVYILNNKLPKDIRAYKSFAFDANSEFHVQYSSLKKRYSYKIDNNKLEDN